MDIPKYVGVVYDYAVDQDEPHSIFTGADEADVTNKTLLTYNDLVQMCRDEGVPESALEQIGWDVYVSTRATANSPA